MPRKTPPQAEPKDPALHWFSARNAQGFWVCARCGAERLRQSKGECTHVRASLQVLNARQVAQVHKHYLETIERVITSEREADPRIKLSYITTAIERWRQDPFAEAK